MSSDLRVAVWYQRWNALLDRRTRVCQVEMIQALLEKKNALVPLVYLDLEVILVVLEAEYLLLHLIGDVKVLRVDFVELSLVLNLFLIVLHSQTGDGLVPVLQLGS